VEKNTEPMWLELKRDGWCHSMAIRLNNVHPDWETRIQAANALLKIAAGGGERAEFEDI